ncbi:hypothetical protein H6758_02980 [Candidatus Nomurabacteria bacterium]|nr:hypothetical protein [Candidatus Nomurabacteria bacterium]
MENYTKKLFQILLERKPVGMDEEVFEKASEQCKSITDEAMPEQVEAFMIEYGLHAWPLWQAEYELKQEIGENLQQELFLSALPDDVRQRWIEFQMEGHSFRDGDAYEKAFSAEEDVLIEKASVEAQVQAREQLRALLAGEKASEYEAAAQKYSIEKEEILTKLKELEGLKKKGKKWASEIDQVVLDTRRGFAEINERPQVQEVQGKIDFYVGQIEAGNK